MFIAPISFLCAGWIFGCWLVVKLVSKVFGGFMGRLVSGAKVLWIIPLVIGMVALANGA